MNKDEFEQAFDELVVQPLLDQGAKRHGRGLTLTKGDCTLLWARGGGRLTRPGSIAHVLGCRHACNRDVNEEKVPARPPTDISHYPWRIAPSELARSTERDWGFSTDRVFRTPYDYLAFADRSQEAVRADLGQLVLQVLDRYFPWFCDLSHDDAKRSLGAHPDFWAARLWAEDYS